MRRTVTTGILFAALVVGATLVGCTVRRASDALACTTNEDCAGPELRTCEGGYCVVPNCPADCTACDEQAHTCTVTCDAGHPCGAVSCPTGWTCSIGCTTSGACGDVTCAGDSRCNVTCAAPGACGTITCTDACQCDVTCPAGTCDGNSCPYHGNGTNRVDCTVDGDPGSPCSSTAQPGCQTCGA